MKETHLCAFSFFVFLQQFVFAQENEYSVPEDLMPLFSFHGKVTEFKEPVTDVNFTVYQIAEEPELISIFTTDSSGNFFIEFPVATDTLNSNYIIIISKENYLTKFVTLNSSIPEKKRTKFSKVTHEINLKMYQKQPSAASAFKKASVAFAWDDVKNQIYYDKKYYEKVAEMEGYIASDPIQYAEQLAADTGTMAVNVKTLMLFSEAIISESKTESEDKAEKRHYGSAMNEPLSKIEKKKEDYSPEENKKKITGTVLKNRNKKQEKILTLNDKILHEQIKKKSYELMDDPRQIIKLLTLEAEQEKTKTAIHEKKKQTQKEIQTNKNKKYSEKSPMNTLQKTLQQKK